MSKFATSPQPALLELVLRLAHLNRVQSPIINRLRQDLAWQFPEVAHIKSRRAIDGDVPLLWGWLCGERQSKRYDNLRSSSIGLGITSIVRHHARRLCDLQWEEHSIEVELQELLGDSKFTAYREVFKTFGFGVRLEGIILSQIYPINAYFGADGKPEVRIRKGRKSGKPTKRYLSLRRFQKSLGLAPSLEASGDKSKIKIVGGSDLCRIAFWQWVFTRIEVKRCRLDNEIGAALGSQLDAEKAAGRPVRLVRSRICAKAAKLPRSGTGKGNCTMTNKRDFLWACPSCGYNAYGLFPYLIWNDNLEKVRVSLFHCVNCGYEPDVKDANLVDPGQRDKRNN